MSAAWVAKSADDSPVIYGVVLAPGLVVDGKAITAAAIEHAAHDWMLDVPNVAKSASGGRVVSSMCAMTNMPMVDDEGRSHSLWFGDVQVADQYGWYETAFWFSPLMQRRSRQTPFSLEPGPKAAKAVVE